MVGVSLAGGVLAAHGSAGAHEHYTDNGGWFCGPHRFPNSGSGTAFSNCAASAFKIGKAGTGHKFSRDITCDAGSKCANALCGGAAVLGGHTEQNCNIAQSCFDDPAYVHGIPTVTSLVCDN